MLTTVGAVLGLLLAFAVRYFLPDEMQWAVGGVLVGAGLMFSLILSPFFEQPIGHKN
jgi:hypothetical protein